VERRIEREKEGKKRREEKGMEGEEKGGQGRVG